MLLFLVQKILYDCYPSEQALVKLSVNKLEELGPFFFSLIVLQQNKLYYEFESPKKLPFPLIILTNISVLKNALIPITIIESLHRKSPDLYNKAYIVNGMKIYDHPFKVSIE